MTLRSLQSGGSLVLPGDRASYASRWAGLLARSDATLKTQATRAVMAVAPTITVGTGTATITAQTIDKADTRLTYTSPVQASTDTNFYTALNPRKADSSFDTSVPNNLTGVEFMFDGQAFELKTLKSPARILVTVDGQLASATVTDTGSGASTVFVKVDLGARGQHRIGLWMSNAFFGGLRLNATDTIWTIGDAAIPRLTFFGDSYTVFGPTTAYTSSYNTYAQQLGRLLGFRAITNYSAAGTGFAHASGATSGTIGFGCGQYSTRLADLVAAQPEIVLVQGSINDTSTLTTDLQAAADSLYAALKAGLPKALIVATGTVDARPASGQATTPARDAILSASASAAGLPFIPTAGWVFGTGNVGTPTGNGNADFYAWTDVAHPTGILGGDYLASRMYDGLRKLLV